MPRITLKPNSPDFDDGKTAKRPLKRCCDMPGCPGEGEFRAPRDRSLSGYYWFCLPHIQEYNKAWDYFSGMSTSEVQDYIYNATVWDRPTRRYDNAAKTEDLNRKAWQFYHFTEEEPPRTHTPPRQHPQTPEHEALAMMGLAPPVDLDAVKSRYKALAKKYHPDHNRDDPNAEEQLKKINMAYTVLKLAYRKFEELPTR